MKKAPSTGKPDKPTDFTLILLGGLVQEVVADRWLVKDGVLVFLKDDSTAFACPLNQVVWFREYML